MLHCPGERHLFKRAGFVAARFRRLTGSYSTNSAVPPVQHAEAPVPLSRQDAGTRVLLSARHRISAFFNSQCPESREAVQAGLHDFRGWSESDFRLLRVFH
jgi:hypothetical protein